MHGVVARSRMIEELAVHGLTSRLLIRMQKAVRTHTEVEG